MTLWRVVTAGTVTEGSLEASDIFAIVAKCGPTAVLTISGAFATIASATLLRSGACVASIASVSSVVLATSAAAITSVVLATSAVRTTSGLSKASAGVSIAPVKGGAVPSGLTGNDIVSKCKAYVNTTTATR